jgi:hypothetical protein
MQLRIRPHGQSTRHQVAVQRHALPQGLTDIQKIRCHLSSLTRTMQLTQTRTCVSSWHNAMRPLGHLNSSRSCYRPPCLTRSLISLKATPPGLIPFSTLLSRSGVIPPFAFWSFLVRTLRSRAFWCNPLFPSKTASFLHAMNQGQTKAWSSLVPSLGKEIVPL